MAERRYWQRRDHHLQGVGMLGLSRHRRAEGQRLQPHRHPESWEICYIDSGDVHWWVGHEVYEIPPRTWYVTQPNELHGAVGGIMEPCRLGWMQVPQHHKRIAGLNPSDSALVHQHLYAMPRLTPASDSRLSLWNKLADELTQPAELLAAPRQQQALQALLFALLDDQRARAAAVVDDAIERTVQWLHKQEHVSMNIAELAEVAGLGRSRFAARFKEETGYSPADFMTRLKVMRARTLLRDEQRSVTEIALQLDFSSSQYFAACFRRYTGMSPSAWRAAFAQHGLET